MISRVFTKKNFNSVIVGLCLTIFFASPLQASENTEKFNAGDLILHHVADAHEWHFATIGETHVTLPLPVIIYDKVDGLKVFSSSNFHAHHGEPSHPSADDHRAHPSAHEEVDHHEHTITSEIHEGYGLDSEGKLVSIEGHEFYDLSFTKNVASMLLSVVLLLVVFLGIGSFYSKNGGKVVPTGAARLIEPIIIFIRDEVAIPAIGHKHHARFMPYLLTLFFFIWFNNLMGLLPGGANVTGNIAVTLVLAVITFFVVNLNANKDYWMHIFWTPGVPWWLKTIFPVMPIVEFLGLFTKPFSLMIRLFANITAGHIIILSLLSLIFLFESFAVGVVSAAFASAMNLLEFLVAVLQAYVFTLLTANYIGAAVADHHHDDVSHSAANHPDDAHDLHVNKLVPEVTV